ncbi:DNA mismatch repair protein [Yarrowia sp. C11]|nr:DNA mismatch repair protein [Yarrowia sp. E02]KAG5371485.1 DNA mismatch repair protein [Yarrowia sp. C11]
MAKAKQQSVLSFFKKTPVKESKKKDTSTSNDKTDEKTSPTTPVTPETVTKSTLKSLEATTISSKPPPKFDTTGNVPTPSSEFEDGEEHSSPVKRHRKQRVQLDDSDLDLDSEDEADFKPTKSKRRVIDDDDSDSDGYAPSEEEADDHVIEGAVNEADVSDVEMADDDDEEPVVAVKKKASPKSSQSGSSNLAKFSAKSAYTSEKSSRPVAKKAATNGGGKHSEFAKNNTERYKWLIDIKDAQGNPEGSPDYDPRTLYIPSSAWSKFTAFEKQYWEVKSKMWNTVVFFKKGKFYELYERDADIAHSEFDLKLAGGGRANMRLCGVPEMSFFSWSNAFIKNGHKVARVDQKESALAKEMRETATLKKEDKVIKRELSLVLTSGTLTDEKMLTTDLATYCMAVKQEGSRIAVAFVDTASGAFHTSSFEDDADFSKFETLVAQIRPGEVLLEKGVVDKAVIKILKRNTTINTLWNHLIPKAEFWDATTAMEQLTRGKYFEAEDLDDMTNYPEHLKSFMEDDVCMSAFGALLWYMQYLKLDKELVSLGNFSDYEPIQSEYMVLDGHSLQNLEIFANSYDSTDAGTLFKLLNKCVSPFGKRLLQQWVALPLLDQVKIEARLDAVEAFMEDDFGIERRLAKLPDLERLLARIHAGRIMPKDFVRVVEGFEEVYHMVAGLSEKAPESAPLIRTLIESLPNLESMLVPWDTKFDRQKAKEGLLIPEPGVEKDFDASRETIKGLEDELMVKLRQYRKEYKSQEIKFYDSGKEIYLIEMPVKLVKQIPNSWQQMSGTAKVKRFWSPEVKALVRKLMEAREDHKTIESAMEKRMYAQFDESYSSWLRCVEVCAQLDCLLSLAKCSQTLGSPSCRPEFVPYVPGTDATLKFEELRHPCFDSTKQFIPNDVSLGGDEANITLLTGANAAGKSTVLRMTCTAAVMAQMGCHVPAASARLTPVDRIITRLGAQDNIFAGKSTFYVELSETKKVFDATPQSLIVLDELGRGGSSADGFAIAEAVLHHVATQVGCLGFFATHYGTLHTSFTHHPQVRPMRMAILVSEASKEITFLYKLEPGSSPGSFGMHVASMCGIDKSIVDNAEQAAKKFEHTAKMKKLLEAAHSDDYMPLGAFSDFVWLLNKPTDFTKRGVRTMAEYVQ